jgi:hypothetical protein
MTEVVQQTGEVLHTSGSACLIIDGQEPGVVGIQVVKVDAGDEFREVWRVVIVAAGQIYDSGEEGAVRSGAMAVGGGAVPIMATTLSLLGAAAKAYSWNMRNADVPSENSDLFPGWVNEWAYFNVERLASARCDLEPESGTCGHCGRGVVNVGGKWIDPEATGDDAVWRETCDGNDTFEANREVG